MRARGVERQGDIVMMGVASDGAYGIPDGYILSMPVVCDGDGSYRIVRDVPLSESSRASLRTAVADLESELAEAQEFLRQS